MVLWGFLIPRKLSSLIDGIYSAVSLSIFIRGLKCYFLFRELFLLPLGQHFCCFPAFSPSHGWSSSNAWGSFMAHSHARGKDWVVGWCFLCYGVNWPSHPLLCRLGWGPTCGMGRDFLWSISIFTGTHSYLAALQFRGLSFPQQLSSLARSLPGCH